LGDGTTSPRLCVSIKADMASLTIRRILLLILGIAVAIATGLFTGVLGMVM